MTRTDEQVAADDALTAAIEQVQKAYAEDDPHTYLLTDYVVVSAGTRFDDDGTAWTRVATNLRDNDIPAWRALGLLDYALTRMRMYVSSDED